MITLLHSFEDGYEWHGVSYFAMWATTIAGPINQRFDMTSSGCNIIILTSLTKLWWWKFSYLYNIPNVSLCCCIFSPYLRGSCLEMQLSSGWCCLVFFLGGYLFHLLFIVILLPVLLQINMFHLKTSYIHLLLSVSLLFWIIFGTFSSLSIQSLHMLVFIAVYTLFLLLAKLAEVVHCSQGCLELI